MVAVDLPAGRQARRRGMGGRLAKNLLTRGNHLYSKGVIRVSILSTIGHILRDKTAHS